MHRCTIRYHYPPFQQKLLNIILGLRARMQVLRRSRIRESHVAMPVQDRTASGSRSDPGDWVLTGLRHRSSRSVAASGRRPPALPAAWWQPQTTPRVGAACRGDLALSRTRGRHGDGARCCAHGRDDDDDSKQHHQWQRQRVAAALRFARRRHAPAQTSRPQRSTG